MTPINPENQSEEFLRQEVARLRAQLVALEARAEAVLVTEKKFEGLWEAAPDANILVDNQGRIQWVNARSEELFAYSRTELLKQSIETLIPLRYRAHHVQKRQNYLLMPHIRPMGIGQEFWILTKPGHEIPVEISLSSLELDQDPMILCVIRDITERKQNLKLIDEQSRSLMALSTPAISLFDGILLMPLIGVVDSLRARHLMGNLLKAIASQHAKVALLDITGVPIIDSEVAGNLLNAVHAAQLLGAQVILTGFHSASAQSLVELGIEMSTVRTMSSLQAGILEAFKLIGKKLGTV